MYIGIDNTARKTKGIYVGVDGVAREVKKAYVGVNGVAKLFWESTPALPDIAPEKYDLIDEYYKETTFTAPETGWYRIELISPSTNGGGIEGSLRVNGESYALPLTLKATNSYTVKFSAASYGGSGSCYACSYVKLKKNDTVVMNWVTKTEIKAKINSTYSINEVYEDIGIRMDATYWGNNIIYGADYYEASEGTNIETYNHEMELKAMRYGDDNGDGAPDNDVFYNKYEIPETVVLGRPSGSKRSKTCGELGLGGDGGLGYYYIIYTEFSDDDSWTGYVDTATISEEWIYNTVGSTIPPEPFQGCFRISKGIL